MDDPRQTFTVHFLDGAQREVRAVTFAAALVVAAYTRVLEGACTHRQLTPAEALCRQGSTKGTT